jgi:hypothetical protein
MGGRQLFLIAISRPFGDLVDEVVRSLRDARDSFGIVAAIELADELCGLQLSESDKLHLASLEEGHPDLRPWSELRKTESLPQRRYPLRQHARYVFHLLREGRSQALLQGKQRHYQGVPLQDWLSAACRFPTAAGRILPSRQTDG